MSCSFDFLFINLCVGLCVVVLFVGVVFVCFLFVLMGFRVVVFRDLCVCCFSLFVCFVSSL